MLLGRQGLPIRGHREMMTDSMTNTGNFLETLKLLSTYDPPLQEHLEKIIERHQSASEGSSGQKGRGSVLTFMSYKSQINSYPSLTNTLLAQLLKQFIIAELGHLWQTQRQTLAIMSR